ncbi:MAG: ASCH domain-containing protein [Desulfurococcaceae archaeon]
MKNRVRYIGRHLMMRKIYADALLSGLKKATIRLGIVKPKYKELILHSDGKPIAKVLVKNVYYKRIYELNDEDAVKDGFSSVHELLRDLERIYGKLPLDAYVTIMELEVLERFDRIKPQDPYYGLKPVDVARIALRYLDKQMFSEEELKILYELTRSSSIRAIALKHYGDLNKRYLVRRVLRKAIKLLLDRGLIGGVS